MASRFYFSISAAAPVSPTFGGEWTYTTEAVRRKLLRHKYATGEAIASGTQIGPWTPGDFALDRQYVSDPMEAQTISGVIRCQISSREHAATDNVFTRMKIFVVDNAGTTVRGTILAFGAYGQTGTELLDTGFRNKTWAENDALTSLAVLAGDRLVIELGYTDTTGTTPEATSRWGAADQAELTTNSETTTTAFTPWIEFSHTVQFQGALPVTVNRELDYDLVRVETDFVTTQPATINRAIESGFVSAITDPFVRDISPLGDSPCAPPESSSIEFTIGTVLPETVNLSTLVVTVRYGVSAPVTVYNGGGGGFQAGWSGSVTDISTVDENLHRVVITPDIPGFPEFTPVAVTATAQNNLAVSPSPTPTWDFWTCEFNPCLLQRAFDSGTQGYVYWLTVAPNANPIASITTPNYTGTLSAYAIILPCQDPPVSYYQRAFDSGTAGYVYWETAAPDSTPDMADTTPNYTGSLSAYSIIFIER